METQFTVIGEQNKFKVKKSSKNKSEIAFIKKTRSFGDEINRLQ